MTEKILAGQVAIVTGASSGLGYRFSQYIASLGATVVATARRVDKLEALASGAAAAGDTIIPKQLDVTDATQIANLVDEVSNEVGLVQILVNNAGIPDAKRAHKMPLELVDAVLDTNVRAVWLLSTEVGGRLIAAGKPGRIINISSMGGVPLPGRGCRALFRVEGCSRAHHGDDSPPSGRRTFINVNAIAPGAFSSEMMDGMISRTGRDPADTSPRKRIGDPKGLDSSLYYLLSPESEYVTGTVLKVDDGQGGR